MTGLVLVKTCFGRIDISAQFETGMPGYFFRNFLSNSQSADPSNTFFDLISKSIRYSNGSAG
ncbi:MAG: hypothetical protein IPN29_00540 [Saprospiraceae bacterium]|nr:hypothetical protein [Saprospiraceae bacterium]